VSTCTRKRTGLYFCSVACWEAHLPAMRHREAWAVEKKAPTELRYKEEQRQEAARVAEREAEEPNQEESRSAAPIRRVVDNDEVELSDDNLPQDVLVVVSKLKKYIRARSGFNTSDTVTPVISEFIRKLCDQAIRTAGVDGRKTVMDRDFRGLF
jgi:histone H3/H4